MSQDSYVGIHGRSPYDDVPDHDHFVAAYWEDVDRGICPQCGRVVSWDAGNKIWRVRRNLNVLILTDSETDTLVGLLKTFHGRNTDRIAELIQGMKNLNKPFEEST